MSKAEELREAINVAIPTSDLEWPGDAEVQTAIAAAICDTLGITREMAYTVGAAHVYSGHPDAALMRAAEAAFCTLLEVAGR